MTEKIVVESNAGLRLDVFLSEYDKTHTRSYFSKLIADCRVLVNGKSVKAGYKVVIGDNIEISHIEVDELSAEPENIDLDIVYEDCDIIVVNKPQGMVVHPAVGNPHGTLVNALAYRTKLSDIGDKFRPGIVHRLDKDTSGLMVVAKNNAAHNNLASQIASKAAGRIYLAVVQGTFENLSGTIDKNIARSKKNRLKYEVSSEGKSAVTDYRTIERFKGYSLVEFRLHTGRTHQIRVHSAYMHHPIVGDTLYNSNPCPFKFLKGQALVAVELHLDLPSTGERKIFKIDPPDYFNKLLSILREQK